MYFHLLTSVMDIQGVFFMFHVKRYMQRWWNGVHASLKMM